MFGNKPVPRRLALASGLGAIGLAATTIVPTAESAQPSPEMNVKTGFGAKGDDRADDTAAIQAALDHAISVGGVLVIPRGIYRITGLVAKWRNPPLSITLLGEGSRATVLRGVGAGPILTLDATGVLDTNSQFRSFSLYREPALPGVGLLTRQLARAAFDDVGIQGCTVGWENEGSLILRVTSSFFIGNEIGVRMRGYGATTPNLITFSCCDARANRRWGFDIDDGDGIRLVDCELSNNGRPSDPATGALIFRSRLGRSSGTASVTMDGCWLEANHGIALFAEDAAALQINLRDTVFYSSEHGHAVSIGAVKGIMLDNIRAPSPGDLVTMCAGFSIVRGGVIHTLDDRSTRRSHRSVATAAGTLDLN